ncbi:hypothetical protein JUN65_08600 [Gluconacetobacter azotocaptans]|uniref:hypothetical protein n=1 Tax=Gluconacetobacter azotocaptans TaxID=142834 RepID=UPI00195EBA23|nr:hypothetical protein [Gluconacetobacter azotocaptans]MBM9401644.1 hypothetical protein [Gluconacetobacter azotocaptans]
MASVTAAVAVPAVGMAGLRRLVAILHGGGGYISGRGARMAVPPALLCGGRRLFPILGEFAGMMSRLARTMAALGHAVDQIIGKIKKKTSHDRNPSPFRGAFRPSMGRIESVRRISIRGVGFLMRGGMKKIVKMKDITINDHNYPFETAGCRGRSIYG